MFAGQDESDSTRRNTVDPFDVGPAAEPADGEIDPWPDHYQTDADEASMEEAGYGYGV